MVLGVGENHLRERAMHAWPDRLGRYAVVLEPERDVVAGACHDELRLRILEHDADRVARVVGWPSIHEELALGLAAARSIEQAREGREKSVYPCRCSQKDAFAGLDASRGPAPPRLSPPHCASPSIPPDCGSLPPFPTIGI